ncbi:MAG: MCE family protein [Pseudomonadales bacterium]|nr:MCE family protein [Pseudomonadales bacterium]
MSSKVSATAIGAFVVGALALVSAAAVFFGGSMFGTNNEMRAASVIFTGSVKGLNIGAPVTLRGVKIGEVSDIGISYDSKTQEFVIPVIVAVNSHDLGMGEQPSESEFLEPLVARGLRAQLKTQSLLTGLLYVDLDFLPDSPPVYSDFVTEEPQIPTAPTELQAILQRIGSIDIQAFVEHADSALRGIDALLGDPETKRIPAQVNATLEETQRLAASVERQVAQVSARINGLTASADGAVADVRTEVRELGTHLGNSLAQLDATLATIRGTADDLGYAMSEESPAVHELTQSADELGRAARALQALADSLEREPESLLRGRRERNQK